MVTIVLHAAHVSTNAQLELSPRARSSLLTQSSVRSVALALTLVQAVLFLCNCRDTFKEAAFGQPFFMCVPLFEGNLYGAYKAGILGNVLYQYLMS